MKKLVFFIALAAFGQQTGYKYNPFTQNLDLAGNGFTAPSGYSTALSGALTATITAATHGQGTMPDVTCWLASTGEKVSPQILNPSFLGDITVNFGSAFTGTCRIAGPGANAGAAGDVVGPAGATAGALACYSGTSGKIIAGCTPLSTPGAVPYVVSAGVLGQDATALSWDPATDILTAASLTLGSSGIIRKGSSLFEHTYSDPAATGLNTFVGVGAGNLTMATPGSPTYTSFNTGVGNGVLASITTAFRLTGVGTNALNANTTGPYNTAFGAYALSKVTTADSNSAFGSDSMKENLGGYNNAAFGTASMTANTSGYSNAAFGNLALAANIGGWMNVAVGDNALRANTSGTRNTALGFNALGANLTGIQNVAIGEGVLPIHTSGNYNIAIGPGAMYVHTSGDNNTVIGVSSMLAHTTGGENVALGQSTLQSSTTGVGNIAIGWQAADALTTGSGNIVIGKDIDLPATSSSNMLDIGNLIYGFGLTSTGTTVSSGRIAIGKSTDDGVNRLQVVGGLAYTGGLGGDYAILSSYFLAGAGAPIGWAGRSYMSSPLDGRITVTNNAQTDFDRMNFGGDTIGFPSLKRSSATLQVRLADDSAFATLDMGIPKFSGTNSTGAGSALLGANSPASTLTAPYTWITVVTADGSTAYIPAWK